MEWAEEDAAEAPEAEAAASKSSGGGQQIELRGGVGSGGLLIQPTKPEGEE